MTQDVTSEFRTVPVGKNSSIWRSTAMLDEQGSDFQGRVVVEVWERDCRMFVTKTGELRKRAIAALSGQAGYVQIDTTPWDQTPVMGTREDQKYLGRVVIETWSDRTIMAIDGTDTKRLVASALRFLEATSDEVPR